MIPIHCCPCVILSAICVSLIILPLYRKYHYPTVILIPHFDYHLSVLSVSSVIYTMLLMSSCVMRKILLNVCIFWGGGVASRGL